MSKGRLLKQRLEGRRKKGGRMQVRRKSIGSMVAVSFMLASSLFLFGCESSAPPADSTLVSLSKADAQQQLESAIVDNYAFDATFSIKEDTMSEHSLIKMSCTGEVDTSSADNRLMHMNASISGGARSIEGELYLNGETAVFVIGGQAREISLADYRIGSFTDQATDILGVDRITAFVEASKDITSRKDGDNTIITFEIDPVKMNDLYKEKILPNHSNIREFEITYMAASYTLDKDGVLVKNVANITAKGTNSDGVSYNTSLNCDMKVSELGTAVVPVYKG